MDKLDNNLGAPSEKEEEKTKEEQENTLSSLPKDEAPEGEQVQMSKDKFDAMMKRFDRLEYAASKAQLHKFDAKNRGKLGKTIKIRTFGGKLIVSWAEMVKDQVEKDLQSGRWHEEQITELTYQDGEKEQVPYVVFARRYQLEKTTLKSENKDQESGEITYELERENGEVVRINEKFVN